MYSEIKPKNEEDIEKMFSSYIKQVIIHSRKKYDKSNRAQLHHEELSFNDNTSYLENLDNQNIITVEDYPKVTSANIENIFEDEKLYQAVKMLTLKQKKVLYLIYIANIPEEEIARMLNITRQAINKIKNTSLKKIIKLYSQKIKYKE